MNRRKKRRNRRTRYSCKKHKDFCALMDSSGYHEVLEPLSVAEVKHKLQPFLLWSLILDRLKPTDQPFDWNNWSKLSHKYFLEITKELGATEYDYG